jgi:hypothetical protein
MSGSYSKRDPSSHRTIDQIHNMDAGYNHTPGNIKKRSERNQARRIVAKRDGAAAIKGKDVNHIKMVKDGGTNAPSNLNIETPHKNRGWRRDQ